MATTYYVDPAASGDNNGTSWTHAWTSLQTAADTAVAGDTVYCRGTQNIDAAIDFDTRSGTNEAGWIYYIGCNSEGNVDGTRFVLDAGDNAIHCIAFTAAVDMVWFENFKVMNTGTGSYHGFHAAADASSGCVFINCCATECYLGWNGGNFTYSTFFRCVAHTNRASGFSASTNGRFLFCASHSNADDGFTGSPAIYYGCISHGNTEEGFGSVGGSCSMINCVSDGNGDDGIEINSHASLFATVILGCRITNHSGTGDIGLNANSENVVTGYNYFEANDGDNIQNLIAGAKYFIPIEGGTTTTNIEDQSNTNQGYVDPTNHDFSTGYTDSGDPDLRRTAITVPWS